MRVAQPLAPAQNRLGDLVVTLAVDPAAQNHLSMTFSGDEASALRTHLLVDGQYINYLAAGDYESINPAFGSGLPGRTYTATTLLPLESTQGRTHVQVTVRTAAAAATALAASPSRSYFDVSTHIEASATLPTESARAALDGVSAAEPWAEVDQQAAIDGYRTLQLSRVASIAAKIDAGPTGIPDISKYANELRYYAEALTSSWSPDDTADERRAALERIFAAIDRYTVRYYADVRSLGSGGHQSDWGGYYAELGEALYIVENFIADDSILGRDAFEEFLAQPFETGTVDGPNSIASADWGGDSLSRGEAWERVFKANFDFARSRLSYISNQVHYTYEGAWRSHEGLRIIGSDFYEGRERSHEILREIWGISPFLGEEVLVGADGEELDVYHSLFNHDDNAEYTDDYVQVIMRGLARSKVDEEGDVIRRLPYGTSYTSISAEALLRENHYVGNYGETANWIPAYFWRTWGHAGDEEINSELLRQALKNLHSRALTRYQGVTADGDRAMFMEQIVDDRNTAYPGKLAYATETAVNLGLMYVSLEQHMADNAELYEGDEWDEYWQYAREGVGIMQQQLVDNQYFPYFSSGTRATPQVNKDHRLPESWAYLNGGREAALGEAAAGAVLPNTDLALYSDAERSTLGVDADELDTPSVWVDIDNLFVRMRDGSTTILGSLAMRNYGYLANGRLHVQRDGNEHLVQIATTGVFQYKETTTIGEGVSNPIFVDPDADGPRPGNARAGQIVPITFQPGVGKVVRDNFTADTPYSGYPDLIRAVYGDYLFAVNTTREAYGNAKEHVVALPEGIKARTVLDLVSGRELRVHKGGVTVPSHTAVVLRIADADKAPKTPERVDAVALTPSPTGVVVSWRLAPGATSYRIEREGRNGRFDVVARKVAGSTYLDDDVKSGTHRYRVIALNGKTEAAASEVRTATVGGSALKKGWENTSVGAVGQPSVDVRNDRIRISSATASGYGIGDDFIIYDRFAEDSLAQVTTAHTGSYSLSARLAEHSGEVSGLTVRGGADEVAPYVYLGARADGQLEIRQRTLDTRVNLVGSAGGAGTTRSDQTSPRTIALDLNLAQHPYLRLDRDAAGQRVIALVSADGKVWTPVAQLALWTAGGTHAGVVATSAVTADKVSLDAFAADEVVASARQADQRVSLVWNRPDSASAFRIYRTFDAKAAVKKPRGDAWSIVVDGITDAGYTDSLVGKDAWYVIASLDENGSVIETSRAVGASGYPLASLIEAARAIDLTGFTAASASLYLAEIDAIEAEANAEDADHNALAVRLEAAPDLLVQLYIDGFETSTADRWAALRTTSTPTAYTQEVSQDPSQARSGSGALVISNAGADRNAAHNAWFTNISSPFQIDAAPQTTYRVSFSYRLEDYAYASGVGAYLFLRGYNGSSAPEPETRFWLQEPSTPDGEWKNFTTLHTTGAAAIDRFVAQFGLRGSTGTVRIDDLRIEPVDLLTELVSDARLVDLSDYTPASAAAYTAEIDAIAEAAGAPEPDTEALIARVRAAASLLVQVFTEGFEGNAAGRWAAGRAGGAPDTYVGVIESNADTAHAGDGSLVFTNSDPVLNAAHNVWFTNAASSVPVQVAPSTTYRIRFSYQLTDFSHAPTVGAYLFARGFSGTTGGAETRYWFREPTSAGEWRQFDTTLTTSSAAVDRLVLQFGLRGSVGTFRVDDVRIDPVQP
ncbi:hypothetical protein JOD63_003064 [Microbacterium terrae]|uniref:Uncharacterized protein n=1 Tax=Microbacterium terrae TaxID=69369 RepID=A0A0M2H8D8_9MICO|nr:hypothetical protein [Microbacterium terrae]KJL42666.1 hypothetical protein RS81_01169 [Microbacterium terrae]MBP1079096.1 hypothetical protein [Microbacterium terrae]GLJ98498.1 hypothetical protein GCM10017594_16950 [Microbacterium terrae]